ncbi:hypothetical protein BSKO_11821 [Bryopsis sp. KO-2023]|nr:hypothetical protein BSKO_11821 [Bryopsis sp. KO-2023]
MLLREQKKECEILHSNPLFREFKQKARHKSKGQVQTEWAPIIEDVEAEAKMRTLQFIREAAIREDKIQKGVWASFGKPYVCLGRPEQLNAALPKLHRDEINRAMSPLKPGKGSRQSSRSKINKRPLSSRPTHQHTKEELEQDKLLQKQAVMKFSSAEYLEAKFPDAPIKMATRRRAKAMSSPLGVRFGRDAEDPTEFGILTCTAHKGYIEADRTQSAPPKSIGSPDSLNTGLTPRPYTMESAFRGSQISRRGASSSVPGRSIAGSIEEDATDQDDISTAPPGDNFELPQAPNFESVTALARPGISDQDNPVYKWHNNFVRHSARKDLQLALWERVQRRKLARGSANLVQGVSTAVIQDMDTRVGNRPTTMASTTTRILPMDPWQRGMRFSNTAPGAGKKGNTETLTPRNVEDIQLMECFYEQLCFLVEGLRQSDPLSLLVVQQVKVLLESGHTLHRPLLRKVLEYISDFIIGCGLAHYNRYLTHILTFIRKCVGVSELEVMQMSDAFSVLHIIYTAEEIQQFNNSRGSFVVNQNFRKGSHSISNLMGS